MVRSFIIQKAQKFQEFQVLWTLQFTEFVVTQYNL